MVNTYEIIKFKCIKNFYMNSGEMAFVKDKIYIAKKHIDNNEYLFINELDEKHWISPKIDGMDMYFIKDTNNKLNLEDGLMDIKEKSQYTYQEVINIIQEGDTYVHVLGNSSIKKIAKDSSSINFDVYQNNTLMIWDTARFQKVNQKEYMTFDEAVSKGKKIRHKDWGVCYSLIDVVNILSDKPYKIRKEIMEAKVWEVE